jgi:hypothetical protein
VTRLCWRWRGWPWRCWRGHGWRCWRDRCPPCQIFGRRKRGYPVLFIARFELRRRRCRLGRAWAILGTVAVGVHGGTLQGGWDRALIPRRVAGRVAIWGRHGGPARAACALPVTGRYQLALSIRSPWTAAYGKLAASVDQPGVFARPINEINVLRPYRRNRVPPQLLRGVVMGGFRSRNSCENNPVQTPPAPAAAVAGSSSHLLEAVRRAG